MRSLLRLVVGNPVAILLMLIFMALVGIYSARHMPVDLFPDLDIPVVNVITHYPGASPEDMEKHHPEHLRCNSCSSSGKQLRKNGETPGSHIH